MAAVLTAGKSIKDDFLSGIGENVGIVGVRSGRVANDSEIRARRIAENRKELKRICAEGRITALEYGLTEEVIDDEIRLYREEERAKRK